MLILISHSNDRTLKGPIHYLMLSIQISIFLKILIHHSVIRAQKYKQELKNKGKLLKKVKRVQVYLFLRCKLAFAFIKNRDIFRIFTNKIDISPSPEKV